MMPLEKLGRYEIHNELGKGSMGLVLRAYDPAIDREVAIKTISLSADFDSEKKERLVKRLRREAKAAGKLSHQGIVIVHDVGEALGRFFITMELIEGQTLAQALKKNEGISFERAVDIIFQIADALDYAHEVGVIHRDIKPSNIMLQPNGRVKLTDFGIAKLPLTSLTGDGRVVGSPSYMSPEQVRGKKVDGRADVFSLGIVAYILFTGKKPFSGTDVSEVVFKIVNDDPVPPSEINNMITEDMDYIILRALAKDAENRFDSAGEFAGALKAALRSSNKDSQASGTADAIEEESSSLSGEESSTGVNMKEPFLFRPEVNNLPGASRDSSTVNPMETSAVNRIFRDMTLQSRASVQLTSKHNNKKKRK